MTDFQITGLSRPNPDSGLFVGGGLDFATWSESISITYTDMSTDSASVSTSEMGFHIMAGFEKPMPTRGRYQAGVLLRLISISGALGNDEQLGGLTFFGGARF